MLILEHEAKYWEHFLNMVQKPFKTQNWGDQGFWEYFVSPTPTKKNYGLSKQSVDGFLIFHTIYGMYKGSSTATQGCWEAQGNRDDLVKIPQTRQILAIYGAQIGLLGRV